MLLPGQRGDGEQGDDDKQHEQCAKSPARRLPGPCLDLVFLRFVVFLLRVIFVGGLVIGDCSQPFQSDAELGDFARRIVFFRFQANDVEDANFEFLFRRFQVTGVIDPKLRVALDEDVERSAALLDDRSGQVLAR